MWKQEILDKYMAECKRAFLEKGFELFSEKNIESVRMEDVATASGHGVATLYRYFSKKASFVVEVAAWKWGEFFKENRKRRPSENFEGRTAADMFDFYLDSFLDLYRKEQALLRFNQFLNVYIQSSEEIAPEMVDTYRQLMKPTTVFFHQLYERGKEDGTIRTDIPEMEMLSTTVHLMLAAVTRYAVGLVYQPPDGFDDLKELETLKNMLWREYATQ